MSTAYRNVKPKTIKELFLQIWDHRPHVCYVTGKPIKQLDARCFSHVLSKGAYPQYALEPINIVLVLPEVHYEWEFGKREGGKYDFSKKLKLAQELKTKYYAEYNKRYIESLEDDGSTD